MNTKDHKLIYEFSGSRNLNTSPLDVTGLDGDSWEYMVEMERESLGSNNQTTLTFNNDTAGSNYRQYVMRGNTSTASAGVTDTNNNISLENYARDTSSVARLLITGDSSSERYVSSLHSGDTAGTRINVMSNYWQNVVDNLTSMQIGCNSSVTDTITLRIYQVPKQANLANYDLLEVVDYISRDLLNSPIIFSGLDGDSDGEYLIVNDSDGRCYIKPNNDTGNNYTAQYLNNGSGSISSSNTTTGSNLIQLQNQSSWSVSSESGRKRLFKGGFAKTTASQQGEEAVWWNNTADNITSIYITDTATTVRTGTVKLYRRKSNRTIDPVPMMTVVEHDIAGVDFSAGITISGIEGDRIDGAIKVEFMGEGASNIQAILNNDSGSSYTEQRLQAFGSTTQAVSSTKTEINLSAGTGVSACSAWIYPQSGQNRPVLRVNQSEITGGWIDIRALWWNNTADELTSMKIYANNTNAITGKIRISAPVNTKQASPSFTVTVN
ncbi:MAG: hypothetical protein GY750_20955 [Lentisphaerae bacterium]|nr:hypothetical protein [Lentisphaerota bacterium]